MSLWQVVHNCIPGKFDVGDGIAMGNVGMKYSLVTRELNADSTEVVWHCNAFDAMVMVPKTVIKKPYGVF